MRKLFLASTFLTLCAVPAHAGGVATIIAAGLGSLGVAASTATYLSYAITAGLVLGGLALSRQQVPTQKSERIKLEQPTSRPDYRFAYGRALVSATPLKPVQIGDLIYGCCILNSRPSSGGTPELVVDGRACTPGPASWTGNGVTKFQGDPYDFDGDGYAVIPKDFPNWIDKDDDKDFLRIWIGLGGQTTPPQRILDEAGGYFSASDVGAGLTVMWWRIDLGDDEDVTYKRWPSLPQAPMFQVVLNWSEVYDPRTDSTGHSANQALILYDALRTNPIAKWPASQLIAQEFEDAADLADELVALKDGGTEARYECHGVISWTEKELMGALEPIAQCGAGRLAYSGGRMGYVPGAYSAPVYTLTDTLDDQPLEFVSMAETKSVPRSLVVSYTRPTREWGTAELPAYSVDGGESQAQTLDLSMVISAGQARRVQKIEALRLAAQKSISCVAPPAAFDVTRGCNITVDLPGLEHMDGVYQAQSIAPTIDMPGGDEIEAGVSARAPIELREESATFYAWDAATEELDIVDPVADLTDVEMTADPGAVSAFGRVPKDATYTQVVLLSAPAANNFSDSVQEGSPQTVTAGDSFNLTFGPTLADEVINGSFASGADWTANNGWAIADGAATHTPGGGASNLNQAMTLTSGTSYRFTATISDRTAGSITARFVGTTTTAMAAISANGTSQVVGAAPASMTELRITASADFDGSLSLVAVVEDDPASVTTGPRDFWLAPYTATTDLGPPNGPHRLIIT